MKFEVKKDNRVIMQTEQKGCIPDRAERDILRKAGYKLYIDGKMYKERNMKDTIKSPQVREASQEEQMDGQMSLI